MKRVHIHLPFYKYALACIIIFFAGTQVADAHVKWFTSGSYADRPLTLGEIVNQMFIILLAACLVIISLGVYFDQSISSSGWYLRLNNWLEQRKDYGLIVMRVASAMLLLLSWQGDAILAPTLKVPEDWLLIGWFQFILAFLLLIPRTVPYAGIGMMILYILSNFIFDPFHMLDYFLFMGCGYYLAVRGNKNTRLQLSGLTFLYISVGFSLCWVALEKFIYPDWSLYLLKNHPGLSMGLNYNFFVLSVAFVEFSLGYLLLVCLLQRPLAVIISAIFFLTTTIFGKIEVIGHTLIHGCLIVFLLEGPGLVYNKVTSVFKNIYKRIAFNNIVFIILFLILISLYHLMAQDKYDRKQKFLSNKPEHHNSQIELAGIPKDEIPSVSIEVKEDPMGGYNIEIRTNNFTFTPEDANKIDVMGHGHAHLHVDGQKHARIYSNWYYLDDLPPGTHEISVTLNSNNHEEYQYRGAPIEDVEVVVVKDK
ncbi:MAG: hypothetical protein H7Y00_14270 [Fimbriimonadaceae bacterium]|nr:hypothetical protein [Chitinophagales bacterium]